MWKLVVYSPLMSRPSRNYIPKSTWEGLLHDVSQFRQRQRNGLHIGCYAIAYRRYGISWES